MNEKYIDYEFYALSKDIVEHHEYQKMKEITHHGISRYDHLQRVAYYSYKVTKFFKLNYVETTRASLLHDFFLDEGEKDNQVQILRRHPEYALQNSLKYFDLSDREQDIIRTHMFPVTFTPPRYLESWIVDIVDDVAGIYEKCYSVRNELKAATTFLMILMINFLRIR